MCPVGDPEEFKKDYIAHVKGLTGDELVRMRIEQYDLFLDRVVNVFEYFICTFDQARYMMTDNFLRTVYSTAIENAKDATRQLDLRTKTWHINERLVYVRAISQTVVQKIEPLL